MQDTPDELSSNADTVSRDHDIARNIRVLVLLSLLQKKFVTKILIIRRPKSLQKKNNMQFVAESTSKI